MLVLIIDYDYAIVNIVNCAVRVPNHLIIMDYINYIYTNTAVYTAAVYRRHDAIDQWPMVHHHNHKTHAHTHTHTHTHTHKRYCIREATRDLIWRAFIN
jgi:hypothetical protein